jgi:hypothetical protein
MPAKPIRRLADYSLKTAHFWCIYFMRVNKSAVDMGYARKSKIDEADQLQRG